MGHRIRTLLSGSAAIALVTTLLLSVGGPSVATTDELTSSSSATLAGRDIKEFDLPTPNSGATDITAGPDGNLWFTENGANKIGRITPAGVITEFTLSVPEAKPFGITSGPDGNLWFTTEGWEAQGIGRITPQGTIDLYPLPTSGDSLRRYAIMGDIVPGPDGGLWWAEANRPRIGRATVDGTIDKSDWGRISGGNIFRSIEAITNGPDGNVWWTDPFERRVGRITPVGAITHFPLPDGQRPYGIASGPDGNLWVTIRGTEGAVGQITPSGQFVGFPVSDDFGSPSSIASGPDGNVWVTGRLYRGQSQLLRITPAGVKTYFELPFELGQQDLEFPDGMVTGPDSYLWLVDSWRNKIVRIAVAEPSLEYVALGDSYSAGEGADPYFAGSRRCHRSQQAYSTLVQPPGYPDPLFTLRNDESWDVSWNFLACSGAVMRNVVPERLGGSAQYGGEYGEEFTQLDRPENGADVDLVTITIGGNDVRFADILSHCAKYACLNKEYREFQTLREWLPGKIRSIGSIEGGYNLDDTYQAIKDANPNATVVVLNYPFLFPATRSERSCGKLHWFKGGESRFLRNAQKYLHDVMQEAAAKVGVHYVDVTQHFAGHEICGTGGEWVNGPSKAFKLGVDDRSFHPKKRGQRAYAEVLNGWLYRNGPGLPDNPPPQQESP